MTAERPTLTDGDVLTFALAGCNARELSEYAGIGLLAAIAWLGHVLNAFRRNAP